MGTPATQVSEEPSSSAEQDNMDCKNIEQSSNLLAPLVDPITTLSLLLWPNLHGRKRNGATATAHYETLKQVRRLKVGVPGFVSDKHGVHALFSTRSDLEPNTHL